MINKAQIELLTAYADAMLWRETTHVDIADLFLSSEIIRRKLNPGEKFPLNERDIARALKVSRQSVNQAWRQLEAKGVVELRRGTGVIVRDPKLILSEKINLKVYFEIRILAETQLARLAVSRAKQDDVNSMNDVIEKMIVTAEKLYQTEPSSSDWERYVFEIFLRDVEFHAALREAAKTPWLAIIDEIAETRTQVARATGLSLPDRDFDEFVKSHAKIFDAIKDQDEDGIKLAIDKHFDIAYKHTELYWHDSPERL